MCSARLEASSDERTQGVPTNNQRGTGQDQASDVSVLYRHATTVVKVLWKQLGVR